MVWMTELGFLLELFLNHRLPKSTKDLVAQRIKEVEQELTKYDSFPPPQPPRMQVGAISNQAPSTQAILARNPDLAIAAQPVAVIAQTPAAQAAMAGREATIKQAMSGKPAPGETKPRKF